MRKQSSRKILGTPMWLFSLPIIAVAYRKNRECWRNPLTPDGKRDTPVRDWVAEDICLVCDKVTLHSFIEFVDEPVVESECLTCKALRIYQDSGR